MAALHVSTTSTGVQDDGAEVFAGLLRDGPGGRVVWRCAHEHPARPGARSCANGELVQRAILRQETVRLWNRGAI